MSKAVLLLSMLLLPACFASEPGSCDDLAARFTAAADTIDRSCQTVSDCAAIGGQLEDTCSCTPALEDVAVNRAAYQGSTAAALAGSFAEHCADDPTAPNVCDGGPPEVSCINNRCSLRLTSCFDDDYPDAGL